MKIPTDVTNVNPMMSRCLKMVLWTRSLSETASAILSNPHIPSKVENSVDISNNENFNHMTLFNLKRPLTP
jgi:hypothetical protein